MGYPTRPSKNILDGFNLKVYKGETIGLCGISGGGKSTVMGLIERFYDPDDGSVEYHGEDLKDLNVKWYRDQIGYVGQEPLLFDATIAENIAYGAPGVSREEIVEAAKKANAYDFIMKFPQDFDTPLSGGAETELSGGQKQRVAIARALVKQPPVLLLDEATSALDNESERIVQEALDKLMESKERTCIVIAHRLSTIRNADRIAFIGDGRVKEIGSHDELMEKPNGKYKRLVESQGREASTLKHGFTSSSKKKQKKKKGTDEDEEGEEVDYKAQIEKEESSAFSVARARKLASPDAVYLLIGSIGALIAGCVFPCFGLLLADILELLFTPIPPCDDALLIFMCENPDDSVGCFVECDRFYEAKAEDMSEKSYMIALYCFLVLVLNSVGFMVMFWGYFNAAERLSKRLRKDAFSSLVRQDISYFDKRSVGTITSQLQEDATRIQTFTGEPIRQILFILSSILIGVVLSLYYMWELALLVIALLPLMGAAQALEMKTYLGEDEGDDSKKEEDTTTPGGLVVETLLNMGTVSALTMEEGRYKAFGDALARTEENYVKAAHTQGFLTGFSLGIQMLIYAPLFFVGGYLINKKPETYDFRDMLVAQFAILFGLMGLGPAFQDVSDKKETEMSASRVFYLLDRESAIDPLSDSGKSLDLTVPLKPKKKKSMKKAEKKKSLKNVTEDEPEKPKSKRSSKKKLVENEDGADKKPKSKRSSQKKLDENENSTDKKPKSKRSSQKKQNENEDVAEKKPKSKRSSKKVVDEKKTSEAVEEIDFVPEDETKADVATLVAALEEKTGNDDEVDEA